MRMLIVAAHLSLAAPPQRIPLADDAETALAPLEVARDGRRVTFRETALDSLEVCVRTKGPRQEQCFTLADVRAGRLVRRP